MITDSTEPPRFRPVAVAYADTVYLTGAETELDAARLALAAIEGFIRTAREAGVDPGEFFLRNEFLTLTEDGGDVVDGSVVDEPLALESGT